MRRFPPVHVARIALGVGLLAACGCINPFHPLVGTTGARSEPPPRPNTPQGLLLLNKWCWENRSISEYEELFTDDFRFTYGAADSADNPPNLRDEEIDIARRMFLGGSADEPRANRIDFDYSQRLIPIPDSRPGKMDPWHKEITTSVVIRVELDQGGSPVVYNITGDFTFYVVRGDSALIPQALIDRGFGPDPGRWYIEGWVDKTGEQGTAGASARLPAPLDVRTSAATATLPPGLLSWGEFKSWYRWSTWSAVAGRATR